MHIEDKILVLFKDQLGLGELPLLTDRMHNLGMDSLDEIECVMMIEEVFDFEIQDEDAENAKTIQDVVDYVKLNK